MLFNPLIIVRLSRETWAPIDIGTGIGLLISIWFVQEKGANVSRAGCYTEHIMQPDQLPDLRDYLRQWQEDLEHLRQNRLLSESNFLTFAKNRGIPVFGVTTGDPGDFLKRHWLDSDQAHNDSAPLFHPFRIYPLHIILRACRLPIAASASLQRNKVLPLAERVLGHMQSVERIGEAAIKHNRVVDLAILLEPIYWPRITGWQSGHFDLSDVEWDELMNRYREGALKLVKTLDPELWRKLHESLRVDAASLDPNGGLYLLLRLSSWSWRERLEGDVSGALWIRHIAEVLRRAFEEVHGVEWEEEDCAFGLWPSRGRKLALGSIRALDHELQSKPYVAKWCGLFTGSVVRWYVEGDTEFYAIRFVLSEPAHAGIEMVNLKGMIAAGKRNIALTLEQLLLEDKALGRFSSISFDMDVLENVKVVREQVRQGNIVGAITGHKPDFEFANFTIAELVEVGARIDEAGGTSGNPVRSADWEGVETSREFEQRYLRTSARRPRSLKGRAWGEALSTYAVGNPTRADTGAERPFWGEIRAALSALTAHYDYQKEHLGFDLDTFEQIDLKQTKGS